MTAVWLLLVTRYQRWSRGHKARGQGHTKNPRPRPRTAFPRTDLSRPRTKDTAASVPKKKGLEKSFLGDLQFINVPRIFDWGRPKPQITCNDVIKKFSEQKVFVGQRYRRVEDLKSLPVGR